MKLDEMKIDEMTNEMGNEILNALKEMREGMREGYGKLLDELHLLRRDLDELQLLRRELQERIPKSTGVRKGGYSGNLFWPALKEETYQEWNGAKELGELLKIDQQPVVSNLLRNMNPREDKDSDSVYSFEYDGWTVNVVKERRRLGRAKPVGGFSIC